MADFDPFADVPTPTVVPIRDDVPPAWMDDADDWRARMDGPVAKPRLPIEWFEDLQPQLNGLWLMKGLLPAQGLGVLHGHPGSGKTFLALTWALYVALGWPWENRKVKQGLVVYLAAEGRRGLMNRIAAFKKHHGIEKAPVAIIPVAIDMQAPDADVNRLIEAVREAEEHYGQQAVMVVIDTLSKTFGAGKENTDDMVTYVSNCERVAAQFECLTLAVHHRPKDTESEDPRGHSSLKGGAECVILVEAGEVKKARVSKQKDGEDGLELLFKLKVVELGVDEDGDPVTSCVVEATEADIAPLGGAPEAKTSNLPAGPKLVLDRLDEVATTRGFVPPNAIPTAQIDRMKVGKVVLLEDWRGHHSDTSGQTSDTARKAFDRALIRLINDGIVAVWKEYAWRTWTVRTEVGHGSDTEKFQDRTSRTFGGPPYGGNPANVRTMSEAPRGDVRGNGEWQDNPLLNADAIAEPPAWMDDRPDYEPDDWGRS